MVPIKRLSLKIERNIRSAFARATDLSLGKFTIFR